MRRTKEPKNLQRQTSCILSARLKVFCNVIWSLIEGIAFNRHLEIFRSEQNFLRKAYNKFRLFETFQYQNKITVAKVFVNWTCSGI